MHLLSAGSATSCICSGPPLCAWVRKSALMRMAVQARPGEAQAVAALCMRAGHAASFGTACHAPIGPGLVVPGGEAASAGAEVGSRSGLGPHGRSKSRHSVRAARTVSCTDKRAASMRHKPEVCWQPQGGKRGAHAAQGAAALRV